MECLRCNQQVKLLISIKKPQYLNKYDTNAEATKDKYYVCDMCARLLNTFPKSLSVE